MEPIFDLGFPSQGYAHPAIIDNALRGVRQTVDDLHGAIMRPINEGVYTVGSHLAELDKRIHGRIDRGLNGATRLLGDLHEQIVAHLDGQLGQVQGQVDGFRAPIVNLRGIPPGGPPQIIPRGGSGPGGGGGGACVGGPLPASFGGQAPPWPAYIGPTGAWTCPYPGGAIYTDQSGDVLCGCPIGSHWDANAGCCVADTPSPPPGGPPPGGQPPPGLPPPSLPPPCDPNIDPSCPPPVCDPLIDPSCLPCDPTTDPNCPPTPPPTPCPPPCPPVLSQGDSCDNPLYVVLCPPPEGQPPPTPPPPVCPPGQHWDDQQQQCVPDEVPPAPPPPEGGPPATAAGPPCQYHSASEFLASYAAGGTGLGALVDQIATTFAGLPFGLGQPISAVLSSVNMAAAQLMLPPGCSGGQVGLAADARWLVDFLGKYLGPLPEVQRTLTYYINTACPTQLPSAADASNALLRGWINETEYDYWVRANGYCRDQWDSVTLTNQTAYSAAQILELRRRQVLEDRDVDYWLQQLGIFQGEIRQKIAGLSDQVPGPNQVTTWSANLAWSDTVAAALGLDDERPPQNDLLYTYLGLGWQMSGVDPLSGAQVQTTAAALDWRSSYRMLDSGQAIEAWRRLKPGRDTTGEPQWMAGLQFTDQDLEFFLRADRTPPALRQFVAAISYVYPSIRYLRALILTGDTTEQEIAGLFVRQGYPDEWARKMARSVWRTGQKALAKEIISGAGGLFEQAWEIGSISQVDYMSALQGMGLDAQEASITLQVASVRQYTARLKRWLRSVRAGYLRYTWDEQTVRQALTTAGIDQQRVQEYVDDWGVDRAARPREVTAGELERAVIQGYLDIGAFAQRLQLMGYTADAILSRVGNIEFKIAQEEIKALSQLQKAQEKNQRAAQQAIKQLQQALKASQSALAKHGSPSALVKWYWQDLIPLAEVYARLTYLGWPEVDIERELLAGQPKGKKAGAPTGQPQPTGAGP